MLSMATVELFLFLTSFLQRNIPKIFLNVIFISGMRHPSTSGCAPLCGKWMWHRRRHRTPMEWICHLRRTIARQESCTASTQPYWIWGLLRKPLSDRAASGFSACTEATIVFLQLFPVSEASPSPVNHLDLLSHYAGNPNVGNSSDNDRGEC